MTYPNDLLKDICEQLLEWELTPEEIKNLAADIPGECENINESRWEAWTNRGHDDTGYRSALIDAGRGHLLK